MSLNFGNMWSNTKKNNLTINRNYSQNHNQKFTK